MQSELNNKDDATFSAHATTRAVIGTALLLGIAAQWLLMNSGPTGAGWTLWIALLATSAVLIVRQARFPWQRETSIAAAVAVAAATIPAFRASETLLVLSLLVLVTAASVPLLRARALRFGHTPVLPQLLGLAAVPAHAAVGVIPLAAGESGRAVLPARLHPKVVVVARGALLAMPPLVVFGALFVSADPLFERYFRELAEIVSVELAGRVVFALVIAWVAAGLLRALLPHRSPLTALPPAPTLPTTEVSIALGAITVLFVAFVLVQARWLFGGAGVLEATTGVTVADYARRGFFELAAVAALTLPLLLVADAVARPATRAARRGLRLLSGSLVVLVLILMASALERMSLYTERFGLTEMRLYTTGFIAWLGVVFAWFVYTTLRGRRHRFTSGPLVAGMIAVLALAALNPDALIARVNLERARDGASLDTTYLTRLSADAVPELLRNFDAVPSASRCTLARGLLRYRTDEVTDWRAANRAVERARSLVERNFAALTSVAARCG